MKNLIQQLNTTAECRNCDKKGFYCYTPRGADWQTCPFCKTGDFVYYTENTTEWDKYYSDFDDLEPPMTKFYPFCHKCNIIYDVGCTHAVNGCTDDTYNGHVIAKWKHNDQTYTGMPQFESADEWLAEVNNIEILEWTCPNNGIHCTKGYYPKSKHPASYHVCSLCNPE